MLKVDILTLFPGMLDGFLSESMLGRARTAGIIEIDIHNLRDFATDRHQITDDRPFGGGAGMVLKPEPVFDAVESLRTPESTVIYLCPDGELLKQEQCIALAAEKHLILLSGHYEGIDQRIRDSLVDRELSIGDYVLSNGTLPAAVLVDAVARNLPGFLGEEMSLTQDSFTGNLLGFPQYTRPAVFRGMSVPDILLSGNHKAIAQWRREQQRIKTKTLRPDLISE